jgi:RHS repeat-associated protein
MDNYRYSFNGKPQDNEIKGTGNSIDFGARMYDSRLGRWMACDPKGAKYPGYSPYHFGYCNPIITIDPNGEENIVIVGGQPKTKKPKSDRTNPYWGQEAKGHNKRHFLEKGLNEAIRLKENNTENGEETTIIVFKSDYSKAELNYYQERAHANGINFIIAKNEDDILNYIGWKDTEAKTDYRQGYNEDGDEVRDADFITDFSYVGHGNEDALWIGYGGNGEEIIITEICPDAFAGTGEATLWGCNNGNDGGIAYQFVDGDYVKKSSGYEGTAWWGEDKDGNQGVGLVRDDDQPKAPMREYGTTD